MNEKISALMDGELDRSEAVSVIRTIGNDAERRECWDSYHLLRDALTGESTEALARRKQSRDCIFAALATEPTVLAPAALRAQPIEKRTRLALAMAASVVTVSAIAVVSMRQQTVAPATGTLATRTAPMNAAGQAALVPAATPANEVRVNDYLAIHRQYVNRGDFQTAAMRREAAR